MNRDDSVVSSYLAIKGVFSEPVFRVCRDWDLNASMQQNLSVIQKTNPIGAASESWLSEFGKVLRRRYDFDEADRPLILLAKGDWSFDEWKPVQLWHVCRTDYLLKLFLADWLFERRKNGIVLVTAPSVCDFLRNITKNHLTAPHDWKSTTYERVANGLLKTACEFHLMKGRVAKEFERYHLPEKSFLYLLHAIMEREKNTRQLIHSTDWRLFMMEPADVEEELLRLHQYGKLHFERAGSFLELTLPWTTGVEYLRSLTV